MIVEQEERKVITSCNSIQRRFRIDESGLVNILSVLRKNMYSNPTRIIVQEYANNARDAHVAAGLNDRPIQITCPTSLSPYLKIRDFGQGIPPELVDSVFVVYGASTKRDTNEQIGGFGLGAKSAFSYCDLFEVATICNGIKYTYAPHIDASNIGEMPLISQEETDEESGTLISIPIKEEDLYDVNEKIAFVTEYWDIRPELVGSVNYSNRKVYFSEDNWALMEQAYSWQSNTILYCVEGIPYTFTLPSNDPRVSDEIKGLEKCPFVVKLHTGDITIASNREALVTDEKTINKILEILNDINTNFRKYVTESIDKCETMREYFKLRSIYSGLLLDDMINNHIWKDLDIYEDHLRIAQEIGNVYTVQLTQRGNETGKGFGVKLSSPKKAVSFRMGDPSNIFVFDASEGKQYNKNQLLNSMLYGRTLLQAQLIIIHVPMTDELLEKSGLLYFDYTDITNAPTQNQWTLKKFGVIGEKFEYYVFDGPSYTKRDNWKKASGTLSDVDDGVYFPLFRGKIDGYDYDFFNIFKTITDKPIYGIPLKNIDKIKSANIVSYLEVLKKYTDDLMTEILANYDAACAVCGTSSMVMQTEYSKIVKLIDELPENHILSEYAKISKIFTNDDLAEIKKTVARHNYLIGFIDNTKKFNPKNSLGNIYKQVMKTYPLLDYINDRANRFIDNGMSSDELRYTINSYIEYTDRRVSNSFEMEE